jgi:type I restriction enzyme R subunit
MLPDRLGESTVEDVTLSWFADLGYEVRHGEEIAPGEPAAERDAYDQVVLLDRLREALDRLNPQIPAEARDEALRKVLNPESPSLVANNRKFHGMLRDGVEVEYRRSDGSIAGDRVRLIDYEDPDNNNWLVVNQFTVVEAGHNRRADVVVFINGLPLSVIELKNPGDENATIWDAFTQLQTYKQQIPSLFVYNETLVISDGLVTVGIREWLRAENSRCYPGESNRGRSSLAGRKHTVPRAVLTGKSLTHKGLDRAATERKRVGGPRDCRTRRTL